MVRHELVISKVLLHRQQTEGQKGEKNGKYTEGNFRSCRQFLETYNTFTDLMSNKIDRISVTAAANCQVLLKAFMKDMSGKVLSHPRHRSLR